jgi:segregation and condensation protein A
MQDQIYELLIKKDEITWQSLIYDLIKSEQLNPWNIDISLLSKRYIETLRKLKDANFLISGKVLLAAALLLKIKSEKFINEDFVNFDNLLYPPSLDELNLYEDTPNPYFNLEHPELTIRTPLARKRKVTLNDLMGALQKALEVNKRKVMRRLREEEITVKIPEKKIDISSLIKNIYDKILDFFKYKKEQLTFSKLVQSEKKEDKVLAFVPLLHLDNQEKINITQNELFGEIFIEVKK